MSPVAAPHRRSPPSGWGWAFARGAGFLRARAAGVALIAAIAFPVMLGFVGLATEAAAWLLTQRILQRVSDAAAISAAIAYGAGNAAGYAAEGLAIAAQNGFPDGANSTRVAITIPPQDGNYSCANAPALCGNYLEASITQTQATLIARLFGLPSVAITAHSVVSLGSAGGDCVLAVDPSRSGAVTLNGTAAVELGCGLAVNSASPAALLLNGSSSLVATSASIVGNVLLNGVNVFRTGDTRTGGAATTDPYAGVNPPVFSGCDFPGGRTFNGSGGTLTPGVYCGNIVINGGSGVTVTVTPGTYILDRGSLIINGSPIVTSNGGGVTFVLTSSTGTGIGTLADNGTPVLNLTAENSGPTAGFVVYQDRRAAAGGTNTFNGAPGSVVKGALYLPSQGLVYNGTPQQGPGCIQIIAQTVTFNGTPSLAVDGCSGVGVKSIGGGAAALVE